MGWSVILTVKSIRARAIKCSFGWIIRVSLVILFQIGFISRDRRGKTV